jgi:hypothetical protein
MALSLPTMVAPRLPRFSIGMRGTLFVSFRDSSALAMVLASGTLNSRFLHEATGENMSSE